MKACPLCSRSYEDEEQLFCFEDGATLLSTSPAPAPAQSLAHPAGNGLKAARVVACAVGETIPSVGPRPRPPKAVGERPAATSRPRNRPAAPTAAAPSAAASKTGTAMSTTAAVMWVLGVLGVLFVGMMLASVVAVHLAANDGATSYMDGNYNTPASNTSYVPVRLVDAELHADDGDGDAGRVVYGFSAAEETHHLVVELNRYESSTKLRVRIRPADRATARRVEESDTTESVTGKLTDLWFTMEGGWPSGNYVAEVYLDGTLVKSISYAVY